MRQYVTLLTMIAEYSNHSIKPGTYIFFLLHCGTFVPPKFKLHILWDGFWNNILKFCTMRRKKKVVLNLSLWQSSADYTADLCQYFSITWLLESSLKIWKYNSATERCQIDVLGCDETLLITAPCLTSHCHRVQHQVLA